jgi:hypothetical protein
MHILTPTEITSVAWEGELVPPSTLRSGAPARPVATLGQPEIWPAADALQNELGRKWTPPLGGADYWLLRLACTLRHPSGRPDLTEATQTLYLRPKNPGADASAAYAYSLFPDQLTVESPREFNVGLGPGLKFGGAFDLKLGQLGARISYRKVYPVIQGYGAGEPTAYWVFRPHAAHPLDGSQFVYAVVAARSGAEGIRAAVELTATLQTELGPFRFGLPQEAHAHVSFTVP